MKVLNLLIATFLIVCTVKAQDLTVTQVSHENVWSLTVPQWVAPGYDYELTFSKDSFELDNIWYRKELRKIGVNGAWEATKEYYREENNSVFRKRANQKERLAYNYAAAVGDTLRSGPNERGMVVTKIETITTNDGKERKKMTLLNLCFGDHYVTWIEGIGEISSLDNLTLGCVVYDPTPDFTCMRTNKEIVYSNGTCISSTTLMEKEISFTVQPNPAFDYLEIGGDMDAIKSIEIVDISGWVLIHKEISIDRTIDIKSLNKGLYFCHVASRDGKIRAMKFIKL